MSLTETQLRAMRWINEYPSTRAAWTVNGKAIRKQPSEAWNKMRIEGDAGSILVDKDDLQAIRPFVVHCTQPDKLYALNEAGLALIGYAPVH